MQQKAQREKHQSTGIVAKVLRFFLEGYSMFDNRGWCLERIGFARPLQTRNINLILISTFFGRLVIRVFLKSIDPSLQVQYP